MFKEINDVIARVREGEGGDNAFLEEFEKAPVALQKFLVGTETIANAQKGIADIQKELMMEFLMKPLVNNKSQL